MKSNSWHEFKNKEKYFTTKLSLPKLISVAKSLSLTQRKIVHTLGFQHLLDLSCRYIPKSLVLWLVKHFDVSTRSLILPTGYTVTVTSHQVHQVLGIPNGGYSLSSASDDNMRTIFSENFKCHGKYPTINELLAMFTDDLGGDKFKMVFTLFVVTCFLCPSSNESSSPDFCALVLKPDKIATYDWSGIVLDKLVQGIHKFQQSETTCGVSALSGCVFVLMVIYFEFLDVSEFCLPNSVPRISLWTSEIVSKFAELDAINEDHIMFGRKPMKDISLTPFSKVNLTKGLSIGSELDVQQILSSILPGEEFSNVRLQLQDTYEEMWSNFVQVTRPAIIDQIIKTAEIIKINQNNSSLMLSTKFDSQCKLPMSNDLCENTDKVVHPSSTTTDQVQPIVNHESKKSVRLSNFELLRLPEIEISDTFGCYEELFHRVVDSLSPIEVEEINDIDEFGEPILQDLLHSIIKNEYQEPDPLPSPESVSKLTLSILNLETTSTTFVPKAKEKILDVKSVMPTQASYVMPLKKRPICNVQTILETKRAIEVDFEPMDIVSDGVKKKLKFDISQSSNQSDSPQSHQKIQLETKYCGKQVHVSCSAPHNRMQPAASSFDNFDDYWDEDTVKQLDDSVLLIQNMRSMQSPTMEFESPEQSSIPCNASVFKHVFISNDVEKAVHQYIVSNIPGPYPARSPRIIKILKVNWVDHRTFGLSMQVYGSISPHVMNIMAVAIMEEQFHKHMLDSLPSFEWCKHIFSHSVSVELQNSELVPSNISYHFSERCIGYSLDNADLVFVPACKNRYWYVVIANMRERRFEVICPFKDLNIVKEDAFVIVSNFRKVFKFSYPASRRVDVYRMGFAFASVSNSTSQNDSGVFVLQILKSYDGQTHLYFKEEHAKPIREALTYYLCTHEDNQFLLPAIRDIAEQHGINLPNYTSTRYRRSTN